jgi:hypothetical protein
MCVPNLVSVISCDLTYVSVFFFNAGKENRKQSLLKQLAIGAGYAAHLFGWTQSSYKVDFLVRRRISAYTLALYVASPLLATLTHNVSDDTIGALSTILFLLHLFFQDYAYLSHSSSKCVLSASHASGQPTNARNLPLQIFGTSIVKRCRICFRYVGFSSRIALASVLHPRLGNPAFRAFPSCCSSPSRIFAAGFPAAIVATLRIGGHFIPSSITGDLWHLRRGVAFHHLCLSIFAAVYHAV